MKNEFSFSLFILKYFEVPRIIDKDFQYKSIIITDDDISSQYHYLP